MDWLSFISSLIDSLIWPVLIVILVLILRRPLQELIPTLRHLRFRDLELNFGERIEELEQRATEANLPPSDGSHDISAVPSSAEALTEDRLNILAETYPRGAILESWLFIEEEARLAARRLNLNVSHRAPTTIRILRSLADQEIISSQVVNISDELRYLRNAVAHTTEYELTTSHALEYVDMARRVVAALRQVQPR